MNTTDKILIFVNKYPGTTTKELIDTFNLSKGAVSISLKKLENKNLIIKYFSNNQSKIHPTKNGKDFYLENVYNSIKK